MFKTECEEDFGDWKMLDKRFEVKKYKHLIKRTLVAEIIPPLLTPECEELVVKNR